MSGRIDNFTTKSGNEYSFLITDGEEHLDAGGCIIKASPVVAGKGTTCVLDVIKNANASFSVASAMNNLEDASELSTYVHKWVNGQK